MDAPPDGLRVSGLAPLRVRNYRLLFVGLVLGHALMPLQFITQIFWVQEYADPAWRIVLVGVIGTTRGAGTLTFGLYGGALADRFDRRRVLLGVQAANLVLTLVIAILIATSTGGPWTLAAFFALIFCSAALLAVDAPTRLALVPDLLGPERTPAGISLNTAGMQIAMPISIFASGFLIDSLGFATAYAVSALAHAIDLTCLARMRYRSPLQVPDAGAAGLRRTLVEVRKGIAYARTQPIVLSILALVIAIGLGFPATANLGPTWVTTVVGVPYRYFGLVAVTWGIGALAASLLLTRFSLYERKGALLVVAAIGFGASFLVFSSGHTPAFAIVGNLGLGAFMAVSQIASITLLQHLVPNELRGRVMSLFQLNMGISQLLTLPTAALGQVLSLEVLFPILAVGVLTLVAVIAATQPRIWHARIPRSELAVPSGDLAAL